MQKWKIWSQIINQICAKEFDRTKIMFLFKMFQTKSKQNWLWDTALPRFPDIQISKHKLSWFDNRTLEIRTALISRQILVQTLKHALIIIWYPDTLDPDCFNNRACFGIRKLKIRTFYIRLPSLSRYPVPLHYYNF